MAEQIPQDKIAGENGTPDTVDPVKRKRAVRWAFVLGVMGIVLTLLMTAGIILFRDEVESLKHYGYLGAFFISILGGATIIIPVPMLAVVFALGSAMETLWAVAFLGLAAALGELIGAYTIYMTGKGAGQAISTSKHGRVQRAYERMLDLMERRGPLTLFLVASVVNPFFYPAALAAGALRFGLMKYTLIVLPGKIIKCMTVVYLGYYGLGSILRAVGINV
ncbi:MAG: VTT domain-containing protein [Dehalococcoidales bacterium]|nr:VTT domain-containing protein [Dehalococcoidales bacterium]